MINVNVMEYINKEYQQCKKSISEISKSDKGKILVDSSKMIFCFDDINKEIYSGSKSQPASTDGIFEMNNTTYLVEFKSGFKKRITKSNFDVNKLNCVNDSSLTCKDYGTLLLEKLNKDSEILVSSLKFKCIESYLTLEKLVFSKCTKCDRKRMELIVVIDEDGIDNMENTFLDIANKSSDSNAFSQIKNSLINYKNKNDYFYDEISVFSVNEFNKFIIDL